MEATSMDGQLPKSESFNDRNLPAQKSPSASQRTMPDPDIQTNKTYTKKRFLREQESGAKRQYGILIQWHFPPKTRFPRSAAAYPLLPLLLP